MLKKFPLASWLLSLQLIINLNKQAIFEIFCYLEYIQQRFDKTYQTLTAILTVSRGVWKYQLLQDTCIL